LFVGAEEGLFDGTGVGLFDGFGVGLFAGAEEGLFDGTGVGLFDGSFVGADVGEMILMSSSMFSQVLLFIDRCRLVPGNAPYSSQLISPPG